MTDSDISGRRVEAEGHDEAPSPVQNAAVTETVSSGIAETANQTEELLGVEAIENERDKRIVLAALEFLRDSSGKSLTDIVWQAEEVASVIANGEISNTVTTVYDRLELLCRQGYIASAWKELEQLEPDLLQLLEFVRKASSNDGSISPDLQAEIVRLRAAISARGLRNEQYDRMCDLSSAIAEAVPHLADANAVRTAHSFALALQSGAVEYRALALSTLVPKLRADAGKNGAASRSALQAIVSVIEQLAGA